MSSIYYFIALLAAAKFSFSLKYIKTDDFKDIPNDLKDITNQLINNTYEGLDGQQFVDHILLLQPYIVSLATNVRLLFFLFILTLFIIILRVFRRAIRCTLRCVWCMVFPCVRIVRYVVPQGVERMRNATGVRLYAFGDAHEPLLSDVVNPGTAGTSVSVSPTVHSSIPPATADRGDDAVEEVPVNEQDAAIRADPLLQQLECEPKANVMFSGKVSSDRMRKKRRRPATDLVYKEMETACYGKNAVVASFTWQKADLFGTVCGSITVAELVRRTPRYAWLSRMWAFYRFGIRVTAVPQVNPMASGSILMYYSPSDKVLSAGRDDYYSMINFGCFPHAFMTPSSNQHAELVLDDVTLGRWLNNENIPYYPDTTIPAHTMIYGKVNWVVFNQLTTNAGGPSSLNFRIYVQLINIHTKMPQVIRANAQGIIDINTNVISGIRDSVVSPNITGDTLDVNGTLYGLDYPADRRQYTAHMRRTYQKTHHWNNILDVHRASGGGRDASMRVWEGVDETSLKYLAACPNVIANNITLSTSQTQDSLVWRYRVIPSNPIFRAPASSGIQSMHAYIFMLGQYVEYDYVVFSFYVPKVPYQNGKFLVTVTSGIDPPLTLETPDYSMSSAASLVIDLSGEELVHTLRIPFALVSEMMPATSIVEGTMHGLWTIRIYVLNPMTATSMSPTTVDMTVTRHYEGFRILYPHGRAPSKILALGAPEKAAHCLTTAAQIKLRPDKCLTGRVDDLISLKQLWHLPHYHLNSVIRPAAVSQDSSTCVVALPYSALIASLPATNYYRFFEGSLRLFLEIKPNGSSLSLSLDLDFDVTVIPYSRFPLIGSIDAATQTNIWTLENAKYQRVRPPVPAQEPLVFTKNGYENLKALMKTAIPETGRSYNMRVNGRDSELIIEAPIVTANGFTTYGFKQGVDTTSPDNLMGGGVILLISSKTVYSTAQDGVADILLKLDVAGGDDFNAHCFNFGELPNTADRIATVSTAHGAGDIDDVAPYTASMVNHHGNIVAQPYASTFDGTA